MDWVKYSNYTFTDVWPSLSDFNSEWASMVLRFYPNSDSPFIDEYDEISGTIYYLLYARYGNNPIANGDVEQWKFKMFATIFAYGPTWERKLGVQATLRGLTEEQLLAGARNIFNHSFNPSTEPTTQTLDELTTVNEQTVNKATRSRIDAYAALWEMLRANPTEDFLRQFRPCFKVFVGDARPIYYVEGEDDD